MPFVLANQVFGKFNANGVIGLAPRMEKESYVHQLFN